MQNEKVTELYQSLQYVDQLINQLQSNLEAVSREVLVIKQAKDSIDAISRSSEEVLLPLDAKSYAIAKAEKIDRDRVLVRISSKYYVPADPAKAIIILDEEEKRLLKIADDIKNRISELVAERNKLQSSLAALLQQAREGSQKTE